MSCDLGKISENEDTGTEALIQSLTQTYKSEGNSQADLQGNSP